MPEPPVLLLRFASCDDALSQRAHLSHGGMFLPTVQPPPEPPVDVHVQVELAGDQRCVLAAQVVQVSPAGMALLLQDAQAAAPSLQAFFAQAESGELPVGERTEAQWAAEAQPASETPDNDNADTSEQADDEEITDDQRKTLYDRIQAMPVAERIRLARKATRPERLVLMKDNNKTVHLMLVQNPRISTDEVAYIASYRQANPEALKMIAQNRMHLQNPRIVSALVRNPKTPTPIAVRLIDRLPKSEVQRLAKANDVQRPIQAAARKKVVG